MAHREDTTLTVHAVATATTSVRRPTSAKKGIVIGDPKAHLQVMVRAATPMKVRDVCGEMDHRAVMVHLQAMALAASIGPIQTDHRTHLDRL